MLPFLGAQPSVKPAGVKWACWFSRDPRVRVRVRVRRTKTCFAR